MKVAPVSGTVTLDGKPLSKASVVFFPAAGGRPSYGVTDDQGRYTLGYSMDEAGAEVGTCRVQITTAVESEDGSSRAPEVVPQRYLKDQPVTVEVESKSNTIDIPLTTNP
jgi:hypothetical protein